MRSSWETEMNDHGRFGADVTTLLNILLQDWKLTPECFQECIIRQRAIGKYATKNKPNTPHYILHFDTAPVRNTEKDKQPLEECELKRFTHSSYSPKLPP
jgi:hypothetical protein